MFSILDLLIVGQPGDFIHDVVSALGTHTSVHVRAGLIEDDRLRPLSKESAEPDAIVLCLEPGSVEVFSRVVDSLPKPPPLLFAITLEPDINLLREAMRLGVRDYFQLPLSTEQLIADIQQVVDKERERLHQDGNGTRLTAFVNAKGGSGASFVAANVAMEMAERLKKTKPKQAQLLLADFDFQFGGLPTYLNLAANDGLLKALEYADTLDATALRGYVQEHDSGLHLLAAAMSEIILPGEIGSDRIEHLLGVIASSYRQMVVDLPRRIDTAVASLLHHADTTVIVTQQSVAHLQDARRLLFLLRERIGIGDDRLIVLINRYEKNRDVTIADYADAFPKIRIETLPGDYLRATESINLGIAITELAPRSPLGKGVQDLAMRLMHASAVEEPTQQTGKGGLLDWLRPGRSARA